MERRGETRYAKGTPRGSDPQPGFFKGRLVKNGPIVPMRIYLPCPIDPEFGFPMDRSRRLIGECLGRFIHVDRIWSYGEPIGAAEYDRMTAQASRDPVKAVNLSNEASIF